jgi:hypothetical protein
VSAFAVTQQFKSTGKEQEFKVPAGVTSVHVVGIGAAGGNGTSIVGEGLEAPESSGGRGGIVSGDLTVKPEQVLYIEVGGLPVGGARCISAACIGGFNGGGSSTFGSGGGGASDVRTVSIGAEPSPGNKAALQSRLLVAAGGGGGGEACLVAPSHPAGGAGGDAATPGGNGGNCGIAGAEGGGAGKETEGGGGGKPFGKAGTLGMGGEGGAGTGGAGGAGLYGGGGGGTFTSEPGLAIGAAGGGGGGSNLVPTGGTFAGTAKLGEAGSVTITYTLPPQTCGKTTIGKSSDQLLANQKRVNRCVVPFNALMSELTVYLTPTSHSGEQLIKGILYADSKGKPGELIAETGKLKFASTSAAGWYPLAFLTPVKLTAGTYWIGIITGATSRVAGERFDSVPKAEDYNANSYLSGASKSFGSFKTTNEEMSLYATFEEEPKKCAPVLGLTIC